MLAVFVWFGSIGAISGGFAGAGDASALPAAKTPPIGSALLSAVLGMIAVALLVISYTLLHVRDGRKTRTRHP